MFWSASRIFNELRRLVVVMPKPRLELSDGQYERLAIPHTFKPQLSLWEAACSAVAMFLRILLGSLLFAFWGAYSLATAFSAHGWMRRALILTALFLAFGVLLFLVMVMIAALQRRLLHGHAAPSGQFSAKP